MMEAANIDQSHFPTRLMTMLESLENSTDGMQGSVVWQPHGRVFMIRDVDVFVNKVLPKWFCRLKYTSFQRQLCLFGFRKLAKKGKDQGGYYHIDFIRGRLDKAIKMQPVKVKGKRGRRPKNEVEPDFYKNDGSAADAQHEPSLGDDAANNAKSSNARTSPVGRSLDEGKKTDSSPEPETLTLEALIAQKKHPQKDALQQQVDLQGQLGTAGFTCMEPSGQNWPKVPMYSSQGQQQLRTDLSLATPCFAAGSGSSNSRQQAILWPQQGDLPTHLFGANDAAAFSGAAQNNNAGRSNMGASQQFVELQNELQVHNTAFQQKMGMLSSRQQQSSSGASLPSQHQQGGALPASSLDESCAHYPRGMQEYGHSQPQGNLPLGASIEEQLSFLQNQRERVDSSIEQHIQRLQRQKQPLQQGRPSAAAALEENMLFLQMQQQEQRNAMQALQRQHGPQDQSQTGRAQGSASREQQVMFGVQGQQPEEQAGSFPSVQDQLQFRRLQEWEHGRDETVDIIGKQPEDLSTFNQSEQMRQQILMQQRQPQAPNQLLFAQAPQEQTSQELQLLHYQMAQQLNATSGAAGLRGQETKNQEPGDLGQQQQPGNNHFW